MSARRNLYVAASLAYTGEFHLLRWVTFAVFFLVVTYGFEKFVNWAETLDYARESDTSRNSTRAPPSTAFVNRTVQPCASATRSTTCRP